MSHLEVPLDIEGIKKYIPHRYPFLLVDRIIEYDSEVGIVGLKNVSYGDPYLQGHFPGNPIMPGVLQVEALAQASAVFGRLTNLEKTDCYLTEVSTARFRRMVVPGDTMILDCKLERRRKDFFWFLGTVRVANDIAATVKFSAKFG